MTDNPLTPAANILSAQVLAQIPGDALGQLQRVDRLWHNLRHRDPAQGDQAIPEVVHTSTELLPTVDWDVVICGGTLGILLGAALVRRGWRVALLERGVLRGREQEWNISRQELETFLELDLLTEAELEEAIASSFNPVRVSFHGSPELWLRDVLNLGVDPVFLLETLKNKFLAAGGKLLENTGFEGAIVHPNGVSISVNSNANPSQLSSRLLIDAMGNFSPLVQQARQGETPAGVCLVVGTCAKGFPANDTGDLIVSFTPLTTELPQHQYFWEAFPARFNPGEPQPTGRTTYMFTYLDATPQRPSLEFFFEEYLRLLPQYQGVELAQLQWRRALFGYFPSYHNSPVRFPWARILPVGDSNGGQSPVSFGGFGAMVRHLARLTRGISEALEAEMLDRPSLALLQPYQPNISVTWLFQKAMRVAVDQQLPPNQINQLLGGVFGVMAELGEDVLRPFLQDVVQFMPLTKTLLKTAIQKPNLILPIIPQVGITTLVPWVWHYLNLGTYSGISAACQLLPLTLPESLPIMPQYYYHRFLDTVNYGAGNDHY